MCFRKEVIDAAKIDRERKVSRIERQHSLNFHSTEVILDCGPGEAIRSVTNEVGFSTSVLSKPRASLAANCAHL